MSRYSPHLPTEQQTLALVAHRFLPPNEPSEVFYGGAAGGGKSDWLLMGALEYVGVPAYAAIIFRRTYTDLALPGSIMARSKQWLTNTDAVWNEQQKQWRFPAGATLQFAYLKSPGDELRYQSAEFQYVAFDELTQFPEAQYKYLFSRLRRPLANEQTTDAERAAVEALQQVPLRMRAGSNPGGIGHGWVKKRFPISPGETPADKGLRVFIPAKIADNPHLDAVSYRAGLSRLDEVERKQLEDGDWEVAEGLAFRLPRVSLIADMEIPEAWEKFESLDFGVTNPTCVLAWAVDYDGNCVIYDEYYQGRTLVSDHAANIEAKRKTWYPNGGTPVCYADPSMWARNGRTTSWGEPATDVTEFQEHGITGLVQANNKRRPGRSRVAELLKLDPARLFPAWHPNVEASEAPQLFIVADRCPQLVEQVEIAPLNEKPIDGHGAGEVVDPDWESADGHAVAALRYGAMSRPAPSEKPQDVIDDPRLELLQRNRDKLTDPVSRYEHV